ncbi:13873_t:CDS:2 [Dentiscutata heterogama]|uniref:13873_t:CDS:1 n=1 Tax=Dentiscutata heterogama TaxID=1316150 RepID=A0ACA9M7G7_9GLOM|nr:13873_t:CDS:2 [Dentiscutata heterogama]
MIDALLDKLNNIRKKNNLKKLEWNTQLINAASKDVKEISLTNKFAENNKPKNFYDYNQQYYNANNENEVVNELLKTNEYKKILLDKKYNHFGASFKNRHWVSIFVEAAEEYVNYLDRKKIFDHIDDTRKKIPGIYWVENLGQYYESEKEAIQGWMESEGHKRQIINKDYIYFGAALKNDTWAFGLRTRLAPWLISYYTDCRTRRSPLGHTFSESVKAFFSAATFVTICPDASMA